MEFGPAARPVHALQLIGQYRSFYSADIDWKRKRIRLPFARQWAQDCQAAGAVIANIRKHQRRTPLSLFASNLRVKVENDDVSGIRNIVHHHSTTSLPRSAPAEISAQRFSGVI